MSITSPIKPLYEYILVKRDEEERQTKGGIIIPSQARERPIRGIVLSAGSGRINRSGKRDQVWAKANQRIIYSKHSEQEIEFNNEKYLMIEDQDVFGLVEENESGEVILPVNDRLIVKKTDKEKTTESGLILTDEHIDDHSRGEVLSKGHKVSVNIGDEVIFNKVDGLEFEYQDQKYLMLRDQDLYGVLENAG